jgi:hypothetical protein
MYKDVKEYLMFIKNILYGCGIKVVLNFIADSVTSVSMCTAKQSFFILVYCFTTMYYEIILNQINQPTLNAKEDFSIK